MLKPRFNEALQRAKFSILRLGLRPQVLFEGSEKGGSGMVLRVATVIFCLVCLLFTTIVSQGMAGGPPACGPQPYSCSPAPCAPPPCPPPTCGPPSPFGLCGGILGACTSICGACIGIPAAVMSAILAPPPPRPLCGPRPCPPPMCAPPVCAPPTCGPPVNWGYAPTRITKCKPRASAQSYTPYYAPVGGRVPLMLQSPRASFGPTVPPVAALLDMPFQLVSGVLSATPFVRSYYGPFASQAKSSTFGGYW
jgi:hypothetical protein